MLVGIERIPRTDHLFQLLPHFRQLSNVEIRNVYRLWLGHGNKVKFDGINREKVNPLSNVCTAPVGFISSVL